MRIGRAISVGLGIAVATSSLWAQPAQELLAAKEQLFRAGNYSWEEKRKIGLVDAGSSRPHSLAAGETMIGGFTRARIFRVNVVMFDREIAFAVQSGWRHGNDLTADDMAELRFPGASASALNHVHPLPHELLDMLVPAARNLRKQSGAIVGEVDPAILDPEMLERYFRTGAVPSAPQKRTVLGVPLPGSTRSRAPGGIFQSAKFWVWTGGGKITGLSVEFFRPTRTLNGPNAGDHDKLAGEYTFDVLDIGITNVDIPPDAKALFLNATAGR